VHETGGAQPIVSATSFAREPQLGFRERRVESGHATWSKTGLPPPHGVLDAGPLGRYADRFGLTFAAPVGTMTGVAQGIALLRRPTCDRDHESIGFHHAAVGHLDADWPLHSTGKKERTRTTRDSLSVMVCPALITTVLFFRAGRGSRGGQSNQAIRRRCPHGSERNPLVSNDFSIQPGVGPVQPTSKAGFCELGLHGAKQRAATQAGVRRRSRQWVKNKYVRRFRHPSRAGPM